MVITTAPTLKMGMALSSSTVQIATRSLYTRQAKKKTMREVPSASSGEKKRTPNSVGPKSAVLAPIAMATPGPFEK